MASFRSNSPTRSWSAGWRLLRRAASAKSDLDDRADYGLAGDDNSYFAFDSGNLGLCHTNRAGAAQFDAALKADTVVPAAERTNLSTQRGLIAKACDKAAGIALDLSGVTSSEGRAFAHYLEGTRLFYAEALAKAGGEFAAVGTASSPWLTETALYMRFRTALAQAMKGSIGEWGEIAEPDNRDMPAIARADAMRRQYLAAYPAGRYSSSARNLERRIAWLRGDKATLGAAYSAMLASPEAAGRIPDLTTMEEADRRIPSLERWSRRHRSDPPRGHRSHAPARRRRAI